MGGGGIVCYVSKFVIFSTARALLANISYRTSYDTFREAADERTRVSESEDELDVVIEETATHCTVID